MQKTTLGETGREEDQLNQKQGIFFSNWQLTMAVSHWLLTSGLFLLPFMTRVSAQQQGKLSQEVHDLRGITLMAAGCTIIDGRFLHSYSKTALFNDFLSNDSQRGLRSHPALSQCESLGNFLSALCVFPGCSVDNSNPSVYENNPPGYVVTTIHTEPNFRVTIDPASPDVSFFTIHESELQLTRSVDYEVSL